MKTMKKIVVFSIPRTGTNHFFYSMRNLDRLNVRFEIFHPEEAYSISREESDQIAGMGGLDVDGNKDPRLIRWMSDHPAETVNFLADKVSANFDALIFKVFPKHLTPEKLVELLDGVPDLSVAFVRRAPIDTFISLMKSVQTQRYHNCDTSSLSVELAPRYFQEWWCDNYNWYKSVGNLVRASGLPVIDLSYEDHIDVPAAALRATIADLGARLGLEDPLPEQEFQGGLTKQDHESRYDRKVVNWADFEAWMKADNFLARLHAPF
ncbi:MAG: hypothetical protein EP335_01425 [Alphaproteobacteria bacterium]|nr:MAG: hypothetical protein EP335_01425 [Alphaproteobacteria bacterium]